jgi:hypothetical protein
MEASYTERALIESEEEEGGEYIEYEEVDPSELAVGESLNWPVLSRTGLNGKDKDTTSETTEFHPVNPSTEQPAKKKRGRPRKNSTGSGKSVSFAETSSTPPAPLPTEREIRDLENREEAQRIAAQQLRQFDKAVKDERKKLGNIDWEVTQGMLQEERTEKETLLKKIEMYYQYYPEECLWTSTRKAKWSFKSSLHELHEEVNRCRKQLDIKRAQAGIENFHYTLCYGIETLAIEAVGIPLHGLTAEAARSKAVFQDVLNELAIDYVDWFTMGATTRYAFDMFLMVNRVYKANTERMAAMHRTSMGPDASELADKYSDL